MLVFIGLGLRSEGISLHGLREAQEADTVYAELYTSLVPGLNLKELEQKIGKSIEVVGREVIEQRPDEILEAAKTRRVVILVPGDPMVATTHVDLRLRAARMGVETKVVHAASIFSAGPGITGLQSYRFGQSATVPFPDNPSTRPYEVLAENLRAGLHTLLLLDIRAEEGRAMTIREAVEIMLGLERRLRRGAFTEDRLTVGIARAGWEDCVVKADMAGKLMNFDFGGPPHVLVVPGKLHFMEAESLRAFAGAPEELVK